jgi:hypothetical protein
MACIEYNLWNTAISVGVKFVTALTRLETEGRGQR